MKKKIRTAVIGVGNMGQNHCRVYSQISQLTAVADIDLSRVKAVAKKYQVPGYQDYLKMICEEKPEAISLAVPTSLHQKISLKILKKGIPLLVEKPLADSYSKAQTIFKTARQNKTLLMVGHVEKFNPAVRKLKQLVDEQRFGPIISLLAIRVGINPPAAPASDVVLDLGIHDLDIFNYLLNELPGRKKVIKDKILKFNQADAASILLEYKKTAGLIQTNWVTPVKIRKLYVTGIKAFAELNYIEQKLILYEKHTKMNYRGGFSQLISLSKAAKKTVFVFKKEPLKEELKFFLKNINNYQYTESAEQAVAAIRILT